jgi:hypothetical protein
MSRPSLLIALSALLLATLGLAVVSTVTRARTTRPDGVVRTGRPAPAVPVSAPPLHTLAPAPEPSFDIAQVPGGKQVALRAKPGGRVVARIGSTTEFGSPDTLAVATRRGSWLGVTSTDMPNGKLAWVDSNAVRLKSHATHISLQVDLSTRRLQLLDGSKVLRRVRVGIGRPGSPTPTGRYAITDKLSGTSYGSYYGCCILALSGHQTNTPAGWQGGNRLAIHGTDDPSSIGVPSSAGCLHADAADLRVLMRRVPLGAPVFIRR